MTELTIILNFIIIFLLVVAILYGFVLNRRIRLIRDSGRELSHLFRSFDDTILKAEHSVADLKLVSGQISDGLQKKIDKAALLMDELEFLGEKAAKSADKASAAIVNFKEIEGKIPPANNSGRVVPMPASNFRSGKSIIPEKPPGFKRNKALEELLAEVTKIEQSGKNINAAKPVATNKNIKVAPQPLISQEVSNIQDDKTSKKQFSIASALKALGYGE